MTDISKEHINKASWLIENDQSVRDVLLNAEAIPYFDPKIIVYQCGLCGRQLLRTHGVDKVYAQVRLVLAIDRHRTTSCIAFQDGSASWFFPSASI